MFHCSLLKKRHSFRLDQLNLHCLPFLSLEWPCFYIPCFRVELLTVVLARYHVWFLTVLGYQKKKKCFLFCFEIKNVLHHRMSSLFPYKFPFTYTFTQKWIHLLILVPFQTFMAFFLLQNIKDILNNVGNQTVSVPFASSVWTKNTLCSTEESNSYRFGMTWRWGKDDRI